jgi:hypothetical protein
MPREGPENAESLPRLVVLGVLACPVEDRRPAAPDVLGHLADRLIQRCHLTQVAEHVAEHWPTVTAIRAGVYGDRPYFAIHIHPFLEATQREHWPLADWIEVALRTNDLQFFLLPPMEQTPFSSEVLVYETAPRETMRDTPWAA